jgi:hypothetical protein
MHVAKVMRALPTLNISRLLIIDKKKNKAKVMRVLPTLNISRLLIIDLISPLPGIDYLLSLVRKFSSRSST